jgi:hypothetical protein
MNATHYKLIALDHTHISSQVELGALVTLEL